MSESLPRIERVPNNRLRGKWWKVTVAGKKPVHIYANLSEQYYIYIGGYMHPTTGEFIEGKRVNGGRASTFIEAQLCALEVLGYEE